MSTKSTGLEYILGGGAIKAFPRNAFPTTRDVLRYYSQFWRSNESDSVKEKTVALALKHFFESRDHNVMSTYGIISKIRREVVSLKKILKFKTKEKTDKNIEMENKFRESLNRLFNVNEIPQQPSESEVVIPMEVEQSDNDSGNNDFNIIL